MNTFNLKNDLVFIDLETTGLNVLRDRIIQIGLIKYTKQKADPKELEMLINPGIPISEESIKVHGITPADIRNKPSFIEVAEKIYSFIGNADLAGYNSNRFDIPMLIEEFARAGYDFDIEKRKLVDVQRLFYKMEPRTLSAAYKFYLNKDLEEAHDALSDVRATAEILKGQIEMYAGKDYTDQDGTIIEKPVTNDINALHQFTNDLNIIDVTQRLKLDSNGEIVFNFGKYIGKQVAETLAKDKQYYNWILEKDFSYQVKKIVKKIVKEYESKNK
ncbi:MAG: exonuclease domain-containing protein [Deltaproteobacteria bacterium]